MPPELRPDRAGSTMPERPPPARQAPRGVTPPSLTAALEQGLGDWFGRPRRVVEVHATPMDTFSSHPISRLRVALDGGDEIAMIFKRLQPAPEKDVRRELLLYQRLLTGQRFGAPALYASACDSARGQYWLLLEDVGEWRLDWYDVDGWIVAAQWLAEMHAAYHDREAELRALDCLGEHGPAFYWALAEAARERLARDGEPAALARFDGLMERFDAMVSYLSGQPRTLVHGDISGHNLLVQRHPRMRIRPVDWEWAAIGVAAWDVTKLLAGWGSRKPRLLGAYLDTFARRIASPVDRQAFGRTLTHCEILRTLWYLRWWIEPCQEPRFVDRLLDKIDAAWDHLDRERYDV